MMTSAERGRGRRKPRIPFVNASGFGFWRGLLARLFGTRLTVDNESGKMVAYYWRGRLYITKWASRTVVLP